MKNIKTNVFSVITDSEEQASELKRRSDLMLLIRDIISERNLSLEESADIACTYEKKIQDCLNGNILNLAENELLKIYVFLKANKAIDSKQELEIALKRVDELWESTSNTSESHELDLLVTLVEDYEKDIM